MEAISGLDATFLYAETDSSPMHVGSVAIIEGSLDFDTFKKTISSKIHLVPKLRQRLISIPMSVDYPYWVDDPNFNLELHMHHVALPKPGSWKELREMASHVFSEPLDRSRPLWSFTFVEGIDGIDQVPKGSVAIISKIHHVAIDGMAGAGILSIIFDMSPKAKPLKDPKPFSPKPLPNEVTMLTKSALSFAKAPLKLPKILGETLSATLRAGFVTRAQHIDLPTAPFSAPKTSLNGIISPQRKWNAALLSLDRIKALKNIMGVTLNDVMLAICAGALRKYLTEKNDLPKKPLVAMVPISTRNTEDSQTQGNKLSMMLVQLATTIEDPIERLLSICDNTERGKTYQGAMGAKSLSNLAEVVPFGVANQAARMYSRFNLAKLHNPVFNLTITNVPGPPIPLYIHGHKLHSIMGMAPIIDGMGLIITILSYDGTVSVSPTSDANSMPDINAFTRYIRESANELEEQILAHGKKKKAKAKKVATPKSNKFFNFLRKYLKENPEFLKPNSGIFQFNITGPAKAVWHLDLNKPPGEVTKGKAASPDVTINITDKHLLRIVNRDLTFQTAFIQGRLKIDGDSKKAMRLAKILSLLPEGVY